MSINLDQVLFARAKWNLRLLVPCWAFQLVVLLCLMGIFAYRVVDTVEHYSAEKDNGSIPMVEIVWESTNVGFSTVALVCTIWEIAKLATDSLTPFAMVCTHVLKFTVAFAMLGLDITVYLSQTDHAYSIVGLALDCGFLAVSVLTSYYTFRIYRRLLVYEEYQLTEAAKQPSPYYNDVELGNNVTISSGKGKSRADSPVADSLTLKREVDRHLSAEFGWSSPSGVDRSGSIVSKGVVPTGRVLPEQELRRAQSYHTERGLIRGEEYVSDQEDDDDTDTIRGVGYRDAPEPMESRDGDLSLHPHDEEGDEDTKALLPGSQEGQR